MAVVERSPSIGGGSWRVVALRGDTMGFSRRARDVGWRGLVRMGLRLSFVGLCLVIAGTGGVEGALQVTRSTSGDDAQPEDTGLQPSSRGVMALAPFTLDELIAHLRSIPRYEDASIPLEAREAAHDGLVRLIRTRGVAFRYDNEVESALAREGASPWDWLAVRDNYRPDGTTVLLADASYFLGRWESDIPGQLFNQDIPADPDGEESEDETRKGFIAIDPAGTYVWRALGPDTSTRDLQGGWRLASELEMGDRAGAGLVLMDAIEGADWLIALWNPAGGEPGMTVSQITARYRSVNYRRIE